MRDPGYHFERLVLVKGLVVLSCFHHVTELTN